MCVYVCCTYCVACRVWVPTKRGREEEERGEENGPTHAKERGGVVETRFCTFYGFDLSPSRYTQGVSPGVPVPTFLFPFPSPPRGDSSPQPTNQPLRPPFPFLSFPFPPSHGVGGLGQLDHASTSGFIQKSRG